jgi:BirA family transcriptional regulator, biotin operon repressor / biotin---[acetyl-CoA-carboxylase] ligase
MNRLSFAVLRALADGAFHSGTALAQAVGVTRGTIWNAMRAIERSGLEIHRVRGRGYRLAEAVSLLDRGDIVRHLGAHADRFHIEIMDVLDSTNTHLIARAAGGAPTGSVVATELQQAGRGRLGRTWHSALGNALTFSVLWRFETGAGALAGLSLAVGVALVRALTKLGVGDVRLKWPNDLLANRAKLGGILIEMQGDALGPSAAVIGIGVNIKLSAQTRARIDQPVTDLASLCRDVAPRPEPVPIHGERAALIDRNAVLATVLADLARVLDVFSEGGFEPLKAEWERAHAFAGEEVTLKFPTGLTERATVRGVTASGALLVEQRDALVAVHSAEISVRAAAAEPHEPTEATIEGRRV